MAIYLQLPGLLIQLELGPTVESIHLTMRLTQFISVHYVGV